MKKLIKKNEIFCGSISLKFPEKASLHRKWISDGQRLEGNSEGMYDDLDAKYMLKLHSGEGHCTPTTIKANWLYLKFCIPYH